MVEKESILLKCADDDIVLFSDREILIKESRITCKFISKWGLTLHTGYEDKKI